MRIQFLVSILGAFQILLSSCTSPPLNPIDSEIPIGSQYETIAVLATNDIHGALTSMALKTKEAPGGTPTPYSGGGVATLASYVRILRAERGDHLLWLDAGDEFQGTLESNLNGGRPMVSFFNTLGLNAAAIGNHEFDFGIETLESRMSEASYPYLAANIFEKKTGELARFPNMYSRKIFKIGRLTIGVIGLSTLNTPTTTRRENILPYDFRDLKETTLREASELRNEGAQIVLITAHVGLHCNLEKHPAYSVRKLEDEQGKCDPDGEMVQLIESLPEGTVDGVVSGHSHQIVHHWIKDVPVVQGASSGRYIDVIYLTYDFSKNELAKNLTRIEGPIPICEKVFKNRGDCSGDVIQPDRGPLIQTSFHGRKIQPDPEILKTLQPIIDKIASLKGQILGQAARPVEHSYDSESEMGNLAADAIRSSTQADVVIINSGGIRAPWQQGPITYGDVYRTFPFDNFLISFKITGKDLKNLLNITEGHSHGFSPVSGISVELDDQRKFKRAHFPDGSPIRDSKLYKLSTLDFLVSGGDDWGPFMKAMTQKKNFKEESGLLQRDAIIQYLAKLKKDGAINRADKPLIDPAHPRFKFSGK